MGSAREKALDYLSRFSRTEQQVAQYLSRKGYPDQEIIEALSYLREHRFLDDPVFAESYIQSRIRRCDGPLKIKQLLRQKGIGVSIADHLLKEQYPVELQLELVKTLIRKHVRAKEREKLFRFIASRGFTRYVIIQAFKELTTDKHR